MGVLPGSSGRWLRLLVGWLGRPRWLVPLPSVTVPPVVVFALLLRCPPMVVTVKWRSMCDSCCDMPGSTLVF